MKVSLSVRDQDEADTRRLKIPAAENGVSEEEEVQRTRSRSVAAPKGLGSLALRYFGPAKGVELELPDREAHQPVILAGDPS